ncbi:cytochrome b [Pseudomonas sp. BF-RE-26]|uniref:cytochrome b n=1 Tax=Pseudomonas sp. BF-RE-26 TaxID=2832396 RepID=UPI001CC021A5|nr:cytochrome b/b6 domain-containing protein [Pseudomonas sp. BF-RE-26]
MLIELKMTVSGYSRLRVLLHWLSAAVILWTLLSGFLVAGFEVSAHIKESVAFFNVSLTTVFIPFYLWRLFLFFTHTRFSDLRSLSLVEVLALFVHSSIYLIVGAVLVTGVLMMDRPINVFGVIGIAQPLSDPCLIALFVTVHTWACVVLSLLLAVHIGAVIVHEACNRRVLQRMSLRLCGKPGAGRLE